MSESDFVAQFAEKWTNLLDKLTEWDKLDALDALGTKRFGIKLSSTTPTEALAAIYTKIDDFDDFITLAAQLDGDQLKLLCRYGELFLWMIRATRESADTTSSP